jgi:hypothetical protein
LRATRRRRSPRAGDAGDRDLRDTLAGGAAAAKKSAKAKAKRLSKAAVPRSARTSATGSSASPRHNAEAAPRAAESRPVTYSAALKSRVTRAATGRHVTFSPAPPLTFLPVCSAVTDASGRATCTGPLPAIIGMVLSGGTTARFAGDADYEAATNTKALRL